MKYNDKNTATLVAGYEAAVDAGYEAGRKFVAEFAEANGVSERSVVGKLVSEGVYRSKEKAKGEKRVTKEDRVTMLREALELGADSLTSLAKATAEDLDTLLNAVK